MIIIFPFYFNIFALFFSDNFIRNFGLEEVFQNFQSDPTLLMFPLEAFYFPCIIQIRRELSLCSFFVTISKLEDRVICKFPLHPKSWPAGASEEAVIGI